MLTKHVLIHTDFPEPVAPAINKCGIFAKFAVKEFPATSCPNANVNGERRFLKVVLSKIFLKGTTAVVLFGISIPTSAFPGIGASIRIERAFNAKARSFDNAVI